VVTSPAIKPARQTSNLILTAHDNPRALHGARLAIPARPWTGPCCSCSCLPAPIAFYYGIEMGPLVDLNRAVFTAKRAMPWERVFPPEADSLHRWLWHDFAVRAEGLIVLEALIAP